MLEGLDKIDWRKLEGAYGPASKVPLYVRKLTSNDLKVCIDALDNLHSIVHHQTTIYEVTPYVIPFLIELVKKETILNRDDILGELRSLVRSGNPKDSSDIVYNKIYQATRNGLKVYLHLLKNENIEIRSTAALLAALFTEDAIQVAQELFSQFKLEKDLGLKASLIFWLSQLIAKGKDLLGQDEPYYIEVFEGLLDSEEKVLKLAGALALSVATKAKLSSKAVDILEDVNANGIDDQMPYWDGGLESYVPDTLVRLRRSKRL